MSSFHNFTKKRERKFEHGPVNHTNVIHIIHCSCYDYKIPDHLLTASVYEFTEMKMRDWKTPHQTAGLENARLENARTDWLWKADQT